MRVTKSCRTLWVNANASISAPLERELGCSTTRLRAFNTGPRTRSRGDSHSTPTTYSRTPAVDAYQKTRTPKATAQETYRASGHKLKRNLGLRARMKVDQPCIPLSCGCLTRVFSGLVLSAAPDHETRIIAARRIPIGRDAQRICAALARRRRRKGTPPTFTLAELPTLFDTVSYSQGCGACSYDAFHAVSATLSKSVNSWSIALASADGQNRHQRHLTQRIQPGSAPVQISTTTPQETAPLRVGKHSTDN